MNRKSRSPQFKTREASDALKNQKTLNDPASEHEVHPDQISKWKKQLLEDLPSRSTNSRAKAARNDKALQASLYVEISRLKVELDWLKKSVRRSTHAIARSVCVGNVN